jgi:hypothetical protein
MVLVRKACLWYNVNGSTKTQANGGLRDGEICALSSQGVMYFYLQVNVCIMCHSIKAN